MDIIGYVRFSHPAKSDVRIQKEPDTGEFKDDARLLDDLWSAERMELRFQCFEQFFLPSIRHQTCQDFRICILVSPRMPEIYISRLKDLTALVPQIHLHIQDAGPGEKVNHLCSHWYVENKMPGRGETLHFRMDDDDAISVHMVDEMQKLGSRLDIGEALSFPTGMIAGPWDGDCVLVEKYEPYIALGLAFLKDRGDLNCSPFAGKGHGKTGRYRPSLLSAMPASYIYVYHGASDTAGEQSQRMQKAIAKRPDAFSPKHIAYQDKVLSKHYPFLGRDGILEAMRRIGRGT